MPYYCCYSSKPVSSSQGCPGWDPTAALGDEQTCIAVHTLQALISIFSVELTTDQLYMNVDNTHSMDHYKMFLPTLRLKINEMT